MRFIFSILYFFIFCCVFAYDVEVDGIYYDLIGTRSAYVTYRDFDGAASDYYTGRVVIPEQISYNGRTYPVLSIGENAFAGQENLISVQLPSSLRAVSSCAFLGCTSLQQVSVPQGIVFFASCAFTGCTSLQQISLPRQAELVDSLTFYCCASLTSFVLPHCVRTVCQGALEHLPAITDLYCYSSEPPVAEQGSFSLADQQHCTLHVPSEAVSRYQESPVWSDFCRIVALSDDEYLAQNYQRGDINDDGLIDASDLMLLQRYVVSLPNDAAVRWAADVNADGKVNAVDFVELRRKVAP